MTEPGPGAPDDRPPSPAPGHPIPQAKAPRYSIALLSATALAYEILLTRLFSITQWHHFAYMIISLALLGYGLSGTVLSVTAPLLRGRYKSVYLVNLLLFAFTSVGCYLVTQRLPFNPEEILWDPYQPLWLMATYLMLALPFFFTANCIGLSFIRFRDGMSRIYAADLFGAGLGSLGIIVLLFIAFPDKVLVILGCLGLCAAVLACRELRICSRATALLLAPLAFAPLLMPDTWTALSISPYKGLSQTLRIPGTEIVAERSNPLGLLTVVASPRVPLRHAPGLSLNATGEPPPQMGVFTDGDAMTVITRDKGTRNALAYLDQLTSALPYHLDSPSNVLVLGAGAGSEVLQAEYFHARRVDAVELNPGIVALVRQDYADYAGHLYNRKNVRVHVGEARGYIATSDARYELIQLALVDSFSAASAGLYALNESYLYTVEAVTDYLAHLSPDGYLAISRWIRLPPRDTLKLFATAVESLRQTGVEDPGRHLLLIRGWQTSTLVVKRNAFTPAEITAARQFSSARSFDTCYYPGMPASEANRFNILREPYFYTAAKALLSNHADAFMDRYKFDITPATDDRPYFFHFFKWKALPEILALRGSGGRLLLDSGYLLLIATLVQAVLASLFLILLPLSLDRGGAGRPGASARLRALLYFSALGVAFLFMEIAFIQKFILFLRHPLYAIAVVLCAFLVFAGLGSAWSGRYARRGRRRAGIRLAAAGIALVGLAYLVVLGPLFDALAQLSPAAKIVLSVLFIAPLAFCMGMPFPLGLALLGERIPSLIPWVWGVNGCASVISAVLATLLAIQFGFSAVVVLAVFLYAVATTVIP
jgi:hypothetical protein